MCKFFLFLNCIFKLRRKFFGNVNELDSIFVNLGLFNFNCCLLLLIVSYCLVILRFKWDFYILIWGEVEIKVFSIGRFLFKLIFFSKMVYLFGFNGLF